MGTIWVKEFVGGLDTRRLPETSPGGSLLLARDCHVNRGGEIEQRADFVRIWTSPPGATVGLARTRRSPLVFGREDTPPAGFPRFRLQYQQLAHPVGQDLVRVVSTTLFERRVFSVAEFANGDRFLFNNGNLVTDAEAPPNLADSDPPAAAFTLGRKVYVAAGGALFFSAVADGRDFGAGGGVGAGFIDMSVWAEGSEDLIALAQYENRLAVFGEDTIQFWFVDPDPALNSQVQVLYTTGAKAARAVASFRGGDLCYLDRSGVRSLAARDSSRNAAPTDLGSPIDGLLIAAMAAATEDEIAKACLIVEPRDNRLWLSLGSTIYVFSFFADRRISAWSTYEPGWPVDDMVRVGDRIYLRSGDDIYVYGGLGATPVYSADVQAEVWLPYLDANVPGQAKHVRGVDWAARGLWEVRLALDPENEQASDLLARAEGSSFWKEDFPTQGSGTHLSLRFRCLAPPSSAAPGKLSSALIHHDLDPDEDSSQ